MTSQPAKVFTHIAQALEAETLQGANANRVVDAAKRLVAATTLDAAQVLGSLSPECQRTVRAYFS